jgi:ADP-ribosyl-[dinitrogen reductase] hydrolase
MSSRVRSLIRSCLILQDSDYFFEQHPTLAALGAADRAVIERWRSRMRGAFVGLALGEALAAPTQWQRGPILPPVTDLLGGGPFDLPRGAWGDDTALAVCLAESLLACGACDVTDQRQRFERWLREGVPSATGECVGISAGTARALGASGWASSQPSSQSSPQRSTGASDGPDSISRLAPLVMWSAGRPERLTLYLRPVLMVTAQEWITLQVAEQVSRALLRALQGQPWASVLSEAPDPAWSAQAVAQAWQQSWSALSAGGDWKTRVLRAVNAGGHADAAAAVTGAIAGAVVGEDGIPWVWREALVDAAQIAHLADRLLAEVLLDEIASTERAT